MRLALDSELVTYKPTGKEGDELILSPTMSQNWKPMNKAITHLSPIILALVMRR
jgi:hypothetical protein